MPVNASMRRSLVTGSSKFAREYIHYIKRVLTAKLLERALDDTLATVMNRNNCHLYAGCCYI